MGVEHNFMALELSSVLLAQLRTDQAGEWANSRLTNKTTLWQGIADWPRPDVAFEDKVTESTLALEFKPPNQAKREYVTGLGQMITYLAEFEFAGLVVPEKSNDGFDIAKYLRELILRDLRDLPVVLFSYDKSVSNLSVLHKLRPRTVPLPVALVGKKPRSFWAYWRDLSSFDLLELMRIVDQRSSSAFEVSFAQFWKEFASKGKARNWEGVLRKKKSLRATSYNAERLNVFLAMRHTGILGPDGRLTSDGLDLLRIGKIYGPDSVAFMNFLARLVLIEGRHLDLMFWVDERTRVIKTDKKQKSNEYIAALDEELVNRGVIPARKTGAKKAHFIRDEPKLWNKLGLLRRDGSAKYFHQEYGFVFDWRKIISIIEMP